MKPCFSILVSAWLCMGHSTAFADPAATVDAYAYLSEPDIQVLQDTVMPILSTRACRREFRSYLKPEKTKAKAFAFTVLPDGSYSFCRSSRQKTQALADRKAVDLCNKRKNKAKKLLECQLLVSDHAVQVSVENFTGKSKPQDLFYVARWLSLKAVKALVESGADFHQTNRDGDTPMLLAFRENRIDVVEYLLSKGADINHKDGRGYDASNLAAKKDSFRLFEYVISRGGDINTSTTRTKLQPIHHAAQTAYGELKILKLILSKGGDINARDHVDRTALHYASKRRRFTPLKFLIKNGADINARDQSGQTPRDVAGDGRIRKYLIKHGAKSGADQ